MESSPADLRERFNLPGLTFDAGQGGLTVARIRTELAEAEVYLHGAHLTRFAPAGGEDLLFLSDQAVFAPGKAIRGGIPICFPWFAGGPLPDSPSHGFARTSEWSVSDATQDTATGEITLTLSLAADDASRTLWPHDFGFDYSVRVGRSLHLLAQIANTGDAPFTCELAFHTYFRVADVGDVKLAGLAGHEFIDQLENNTRQTQQDEPAIDRETDRIYPDQPGDLTLSDPGHGRSITIHKTGLSSTVLWNPHIGKAARTADLGDEEWRRFLCIESAALGENALAIDPGESRMVGVTITSGG